MFVNFICRTYKITKNCQYTVMVTERSGAIGTLTRCFFISMSERLFWHFLHFREYDIRGLEGEFHLLITQVPSCLTGLHLSKNDASHTCNPHYLSSQ